METLTAIGFLLGLASCLAVVLAIANTKLKVFEDPRIDRVVDMLPGNNCGACGLPGCRVFAEKAVAGAIQPSACTPGGETTAASVADYLGVDAGEAEKRVARLLCAGGTNVAVQMGVYAGYPSCRAAAAVGGGGKGCRYGCLGFGDCRSVCTFDAISMGPTGLPTVDLEKCTACGDCVEICPKSLFEILPLEQKLVVQCKSELEGDEVLDLCKVACTACGKCVADAAQGLLKMRSNLPVFNSELTHLQAPEATQRCPTGAITWIEDQQFPHIAEMDSQTSQLWPSLWASRSTHAAAQKENPS
jgi:Na+-translocating ferredoxin:NAD+ oxidoreductase RNF subunit RnfB